MFDDVDAVAREIKSGNLDLLPTLWEKVNRFIYSKASAWLSCKNNIVEADDLVNESYLSLQSAIDNWNPDKASFLSYLSYYLPNRFNIAYYGGRTEKSRSDPINNHASLDAPLQTDADGNEIDLIDTIIDTNAEAYYRNVEDADFWESVSDFLFKCIRKVDDDIGRDCLIYMLSHNYDSLLQAQKVLYPEKSYDSIRYHYNKAVSQLKRILTNSINKKAAKKLSLDYELYGYGYERFVQNNYTSKIEDTVIRHIEKERYKTDMLGLFIDPDVNV